MKSILLSGSLLMVALASAWAQGGDRVNESVTIQGKTISINYSAPSVNGREGKLFGKEGPVGHDKTYPVWRAGANAATAFHTDANLDVQGLAVPKGDYTLYIEVADENNWQLIFSKQTKQWGTIYQPGQDLGRVKMSMSKPAAMVEKLKYSLSDNGGGRGTLKLAWEDHEGSVSFSTK